MLWGVGASTMVKGEGQVSPHQSLLTACNMMLYLQRQEKARVENEHKQFVSETTAKIDDANKINEG